MEMFLVPAIVLILCGVSFYLMLVDYRDQESKGNLIDMSIRLMLVYSTIMIAVTIGIAVFFAVHQTNLDLFTKLKRLMLLCVIWPLAYIDYKTYRIPNRFILFGLGCRVILIPFEFMFNSYFRVDIVSELVAAAALFLAALLCTICLHGSIGAGDMKLFVVMGLLLGLEAIWGAIFLSLLISFVIAAYFLITKKKSKKDLIPFGPAIVLGVYLSVCFMGG